MQKIKSVCLEISDDTSQYFEVGKTNKWYSTEPVTEIKRATKNGEMASIQYFEIYTKNGLLAELHHYSTVVFYESPAPAKE